MLGALLALAYAGICFLTGSTCSDVHKIVGQVVDQQSQLPRNGEESLDDRPQQNVDLGTMPGVRR